MKMWGKLRRAFFHQKFAAFFLLTFHLTQHQPHDDKAAGFILVILVALFYLLHTHPANMSERKVLTKYYPPEFDPSQIARTPKHLRPTGPKTIAVRLMAPFSMKCTSCGEYIYKGRKFNARKETTDEKYLNITIYRFYIRCTRCSSEITFKTDPKNMDYTCERGAKRNFESWRDPESTELK